MNTTRLTFSPRRALLPCVFLLFSPVLSGCGGGGGGTPGTTLVQPATIALSGVLLDTNRAPLVGYKVVYAPAATTPHGRRAQDVGGTLSAITDSQGRYSLSIPVSQATPGATLSVFDTAGTLVQSQTITLDPSQPVQTTETTAPAPTPPLPTAGTPPAPPALPV